MNLIEQFNGIPTSEIILIVILFTVFVITFIGFAYNTILLVVNCAIYSIKNHAKKFQSLTFFNA